MVFPQSRMHVATSYVNIEANARSCDDIDGLLNDAFRDVAERLEGNLGKKVTDGQTIDAILQRPSPGVATVKPELFWCKAWPQKVAVFLWKLAFDRLPTKSNLRRIGLLVEEQSYYLRCKLVLEDGEHLFIRCPFAYNIWMRFLAWWKIFAVLNSGLGIFEPVGFVKRRQQRKTWKVTSVALLWSIWLGRNALLFQQKGYTGEQIFEMARIRAYGWVTARVGKPLCSFTAWCDNPRSLQL